MSLVPDVLALHGSPGSGESTSARALALALGQANRPRGVIDLDELSLLHRFPGRSFARDNLRILWPNDVAAVPDIGLIIPTVFADEREVELLCAVLPGARVLIRELSAMRILEQRVTEREPTEELPLVCVDGFTGTTLDLITNGSGTSEWRPTQRQWGSVQEVLGLANWT